MTDGKEVSGGLLDGLTVLDLSLWQPGHTATQLLADLGADVCKVEPPGGDRMRPLVDRFVNFNGHKRSIALDLKRPDDLAKLHELVASTEVVVENSRPGTADRLGIGFEQLSAINPAIVLCSISGFGQDGPLSPVTGHDANYQAYAGAMTTPPTGGPPQIAGLLIADQGSGMAAAFAILAAVLCARRTGRGEHIDVSIADLLASWVAPMGPIDEARVLEPSVDHHGVPAMGVFATADDRYVVLGIYSEDHFWDACCEALGMVDQIGLSMSDRTAAAPQLRMLVERAVLGHERDALIELLQARSVPVAPVLDREEMLDHEHFSERGLFVTGFDGHRALAHPIRYREHPAKPPGAPPPMPTRSDL